MGCGNSRPVVNPGIKKGNIKIKEQKEEYGDEEKLELSKYSRRSDYPRHKSNKKKSIEFIDKGNDPVIIITPSKTKKPANSLNKYQQTEFDLEKEFCLKYGIKDKEVLKQTLNFITFQNIQSSEKKIERESLDVDKYSSIQKHVKIGSLDNIKKKISIIPIQNDLHSFGMQYVNKKEEGGKMKKIQEEESSETSDSNLSESRIKVRVPLAFEKTITYGKPDETLKLEIDKLGMSTDDIIALHRKKYQMIHRDDIELNQKEKILEKIQKLDVSCIKDKNNNFNNPFSSRYPRIQVKVSKKDLIQENSIEESEMGIASVMQTIRTSKKMSHIDQTRELKVESINSKTVSGSWLSQKKFHKRKRGLTKALDIELRDVKKNTPQNENGKDINDILNSIAGGSSKFKRSITYGHRLSKNKQSRRGSSRFKNFAELKNQVIKVKSTRKLVKNKVYDMNMITSPKSR